MNVIVSLAVTSIKRNIEEGELENYKSMLRNFVSTCTGSVATTFVNQLAVLSMISDCMLLSTVTPNYSSDATAMFFMIRCYFHLPDGVNWDQASS
jgi:hypothetical protein